MTTSEKSNRLLKVKDAVIANFKEEHWREIGLLTGGGDFIDRHHRLLRSLHWEDDDYAGNALKVLQQIVANNPDALAIIEQYLSEKFETAPVDTDLSPGSPIKFLRRKDYVFISPLGSGACGTTILMKDELIDEQFVCKKYEPQEGLDVEKLFVNFVREVKLLHRVYHRNVVRIYNHFLFPEKHKGYIVMEYIDGLDIDEYLQKYPEKVNETFLQAIDGFHHLETCGVLHRDIWTTNIRVSTEGVLKIIDLGFGKHITNPESFDKSVTLNWWCVKPDEFDAQTYDFRTEVYFVGKLFEKIISEKKINHFKYTATLSRMCRQEPSDRIESFAAVLREIEGNRFVEIAFDEKEREVYQEFSNALFYSIAKIKGGAKYTDNIEKIQAQLEDCYRSCMLEDKVPNASTVIQCFLSPPFSYYKDRFPVSTLGKFVSLIKSFSNEKRRILLSKIQTKLDTVPRESEVAFDDHDIPF